MSVSSTTNRVVLAGNGSSAVFAFSPYFFSQSDLAVSLYDTVTGSSVIQVLNTNYSISGTQNSQGLYPSGANVVFITPIPSATQSVVIDRNPVQVQNFNLTNTGTLPSVAINQQFDYVTLLIQHLQDQVSRSVALPDGDGSSFNPVLPAGPLVNAGATLILNSAGTGFIWGAIATGSSQVIGVVPTVNGGTGTSVPPTPWGVIYAGNLATYASTAAGQSGMPLIAAGSSAPAFNPINLAGPGITGVLPEANGGTGVASNYQAQGILYASSATQVTSTSPGQSGVPILGQGSSAPIFTPVSLSGPGVTGTLPATSGGTGTANAFTQYGVLYGSSTTQVTTTGPGQSGALLIGQGSSAPAFGFYADGSVSAPIATFTNDSLTGWYRAANEISLGLRGTQAFDVFMINSSFISVGMGGAASQVSGTAFYSQATLAGSSQWVVSNLSQSTSAITSFVVGAGGGLPGVYGLNLENHAFSSEVYTGFGGVVAANKNLVSLLIASEAAAGYINFNVGGRTAATQKAQITQSSVIHSAGVGMTLTGSNANTVQMTAAAVGSSCVWVMPTGQGAANTTIVNNGSGALSWLPGYSFLTAPTTQIFTTKGGPNTYTAPVGMKWLRVTAVGGGGGGGGTASTSVAAGAAGGGGGGGAGIKFIVNSSIVAFQCSYTVGAGGPGGTAGNNNGAVGSSSVFGVMTAAGGNGGGGSAGNATTAQFAGAASAGGTPTNADVNINGSGGDTGLVLAATQCLGGAGGNSLFGPRTLNPANANQAGNAGTGYGGGGAGGQEVNNGGTAAGGAGSTGIIVVEEFYQ